MKKNSEKTGCSLSRVSLFLGSPVKLGIVLTISVLVPIAQICLPLMRKQVVDFQINDLKSPRHDHNCHLVMTLARKDNLDSPQRFPSLTTFLLSAMHF